MYGDWHEEVHHGTFGKLLHEAAAVNYIAMLPSLVKREREHNPFDDNDGSPIVNDPMGTVEWISVSTNKIVRERFIRP